MRESVNNHNILKFKNPLTKFIYAFNQYPLRAYKVSDTAFDSGATTRTGYPDQYEKYIFPWCNMV